MVCPWYDMGVSKNRGTPKSSILIGVSIIFTIHFGGFPPIFRKHPYELMKIATCWLIFDTSLQAAAERIQACFQGRMVREQAGVGRVGLQLSCVVVFFFGRHE